MITLTLTENFAYGVSEHVFLPTGPIGDAFARTMALAATCEADFQTLLQLFRTPNAFGSNNRISVSIEPSIALKNSAGWNGGYVRGGQSEIQIVPFYGNPNGDAAARAVFVHEMAEILMSYRQQLMHGKWIENYSTGESLAQICAAQLHPEGYGGPRITNWLNVPEIRRSGGPIPIVEVRPNYVDKTDPSDGNIFSYGCGILFINYLLYQRGFALDEVIAKGDATLAETYQNLTGQTDGWATFSQLIGTYFPFGVNYSPQTDNLFPLPQLDSLTISPDTVVAGQNATATVSLSAPHPGVALKADLVCSSPYFANLPIPPVVVINQNQTSADFTITTPVITVPFKPAEVDVYATSGGVTVGGTLIVKPSVEAGILESVTLSPSVVTGGDTSVGTVTLEGPVGQPTVVSLAAVESGGLFPHPGDGSSVASLPNSTVTVDAGETTATFTVETTELPPHVSRTATVLGHAVVTKSAHLTVEGA